MKNIIFDIGNVLLKWDPFAIVKKAFPDYKELSDNKAIEEFIKKFFLDIWIELNMGIITEAEAILKYTERLNVKKEKIYDLMQIIKDSLIPISGSIELLEKLYSAKISLYSLTDNTIELMKHIKQKYDFLKYFKGIVVSAEVGIMKPDIRIFQYTLKNFKLDPQETVFIDDMQMNVDGAKEAGLQAFRFLDSIRCEKSLQDMGFSF